LEAHNGGGHPITNVTLIFDDAASLPLPLSSDQGTSSLGSGTIVSGTYLPTNDGLGLPFPSPAPGTTTGTALATFNGTVPNGAWSLYVFDKSSGDDGNISGGWSMD